MISKNPKKAIIVADLGFGDAGKGTTIDYLTRLTGSKWVVRYNGGAQAGHNVVTTGGIHHTFSQLGSGTFVPGTWTYLSRYMVVHPTALLVEASHLRSKGFPSVLDRLRISDKALVITPFHQAANRIRELIRVGGADGTCGVGVGETVADSLVYDADSIIRMADLADKDASRLAAKLARIHEAKRIEIKTLLASQPEAKFNTFAVGKEYEVFESAVEIISNWLERVRAFQDQGRVVDDAYFSSILSERGVILFEGAQGVLLDEWRGFHPHTTWSTCTFDNAIQLLKENEYDGEFHKLGVLRTYHTRHGAGPFPTQGLNNLPENHNVHGGWQGPFRTGAFDALLAKYAIDCCGGVDSLAITHLDYVTPDWPVCDQYLLPDKTLLDPTLFDSKEPGSAYVSRLRLGTHKDLEHQTRLTKELFRARPQIDRLAGGSRSFTSYVESTLSAPVSLTSSGPTAFQKHIRMYYALTTYR